MRKLRYQTGSILERSSCTLEMPLEFHALHRARECISIDAVMVMSILAFDLGSRSTDDSVRDTVLQ